ncbi:hypothetical protein PROFUN_03820 [Planoprotostelium fungivorum]|uniref:LRR receptor-like serine/threonine-protein kinase n=1 Tax=Planoprotostelium fungivorum TaxID=1890364 RepID=A0A2P6NI78_9EUKA|nr:hypothetical protein PROFUN_03820 [Planoprotostelium fungivorum]
MFRLTFRSAMVEMNRTLKDVLLLIWLSFGVVLAQTDAQALRTFWLGLGGAKTQWQGSNPCQGNDFVGLSCSVASFPYSIDVSSSKVKSFINSSTGVIDPSVGLLGPRIQSLNLNGLGLSGNIPQAICNLTQLRVLSLDTNQLTGQLPACIGSMINLQTLSMFSNQLRTSIPDLSQLPNLNSLSLGNNVITSYAAFPSSVTSLDVQNCRLTSPVMDLLGNMTSLQTVSIFSNHLKGNLSGISHYPNITSFNAGSNQISGEFTEEWNQLSNLTYLDVGTNGMIGSLPANMNLTQINSLILNNNQFNGTVPVSIFTNSPKLKKLWLHDNDFDSIEITSTPYTAPSVTSIQLNNCKIGGSFPQLSGNFPNLIYLLMQNNFMMDDVPNYTFSFPVLNQLDISNNSFSVYPQAVNTIKALTTMRMNACYFNSTDFIISLPKLAILSITNARLTGQTIDVSQLPALNNLDLSFNSLSSTHPSLITSSVTTLSLQKNLFTSVPNLTGMRSLTSLTLFYNQITTISDYVYNLTSLQTLDLGSTNLGGPLPPLYLLPNLLKLTLVNNRLTGQLSSNFFSCNINWLDLGGNQLSGSLSWPTTSPMGFLSLTGNDLSGVIPSVKGWASLRVLNLNGNNFSSYDSNSLPSSVSTCDMTGNSLGCIPPPPCTSDSSTNGARLCGVLGDITVEIAKGYILAAENSTTVNRYFYLSIFVFIFETHLMVSKLPGLLTELTVALLKKNPNFSIISPDVNLTATTFSVTNGNALYITTPAAAASLPATAFQNQTSVTLVISSISANPFTQQDDRVTYGNIVGVSVYQKTTELSVVDSPNRINITIGSRSILPHDSNYTCLFWQEVSDSHWDNDGCDLLITSTSVVCSCTHLTNFTVGLSQERNESRSGVIVPAKNNPNTTIIIIAAVCGSVVVGVILFLVVIIIVRKRAAPRKNVIFESSGDSDKVDFLELIRGNGRTELWRGLYGGTNTVVIKKAIQSKHVQELFAEATTLKELHHPNIVMFMNQYFTETSSYFVMEYMDGGDLQRYLTKCSLSASNVLSIANQIAKAMTYVSDSGLVHTRLSTNKILLSELSGDEWIVKICGWSRCTNEGQATNEANCGYYTAPEALNDRVQRTASDVYSFGLLLWTIMKEGKQFLYGKTHKELMHIIRDGVIPPVEDQWDSQISSTISSCTLGNWVDRPSFRILTTRLGRTSQTKATMPRQPSAVRDAYGTIRI